MTGRPDRAIEEAGVRQRDLLDANRAAVDAVLTRYAATNPRLFGSVARGDARPDSDIDLLVDLDENGGNAFLRLAGIGEELTQLLGVAVDVVAEDLLREDVSETARRDLVAL
jgi:predicted nucleotidyltransferase